LTRSVSDSDSVRRLNRGLVLKALRLQGAMSRTALASSTGLSHASITAITQVLLEQKVILDLAPSEPIASKGRGRPATLVNFDRKIACAALLEIDVNRTIASLVDYGGILIDRVEFATTPSTFAEQSPFDFFCDCIRHLQARNTATTRALRGIAISVQGILDRDGDGMRWSPIAHFADKPFARELGIRFQVPVTLYKRGRLLAEGVRWLDPALHDASVATVFVGSTVAMGMTFRGQSLGRSDDGGTEFGHMNHIPNGALCRCGMKGCIEGYAADYGVLRTAYSVPEHRPPAAAVPAHEYTELIARAEIGDRNAGLAFSLAGRAIGFGLSRLLSVFDPSHILIVGPGARAFPLMQNEMRMALESSLVCKINGFPKIIAHRDEKEPVFQGLMLKTLSQIDQEYFAPLP
jgi:predicted NBD/HSP70 family sugar kinase